MSTLRREYTPDPRAGEVREGHVRKYVWRTRTNYKAGPPQPRKVAVVQIDEVFDPKFSVTIPRHYHHKWWLECGHRALPTTRMDRLGLRYSDPDRYEDPNEAVVYCSACQRKLDVREEVKYREWYWDDRHECSQSTCPECKWCILCKSHKKNCLEPDRDYLLEMIFDAGEIRDNVNELVGMLNKRQLRSALSSYAEPAEGYY